MFRSRRQERDLQDELQFHLSQAQQKYGSRAQAAARLGGEDAAKEACRDQRRGAWLASVARDLGLGVRLLRKSPAYAAAAVLTLALCIAITVAVFSVLDAAFFRAPPFPQPERLIAVVTTEGGVPTPERPLSAGDLAAVRAATPAFAVLAAYTPRGYNLTADGHAVHISALAATSQFLNVLGVAPARGRAVTSGAGRTLVISDALWKTQFGRAPVAGKSVWLDGEPFTITGIMPPGFAQGGRNDFDAQAWVSLPLAPSAALPVQLIGRLRPGATVVQAQAQVTAVMVRLRQHASASDRDIGATAMTLQQRNALGINRTGMGLFMALAVLILLIGCANVAGLSLGRATARNEEMAVRRALGAGRLRLVRQVLTENALIAAMAAALGLLLGWLGLHAMNAASDHVLFHFDTRVLGMAVLAAAITALAAGLPPALRLGAPAQSRGIIAGRTRGRSLLVAIEVALTAACLVVVGAIVPAIRRQIQQPLGLQPEHVLTASLTLRTARLQTAATQSQLTAHLHAAAVAVPGVEQAALVSPPPLASNPQPVVVRGQAPPDWRKLPLPNVFYTSAGYLPTLQIPLLSGRALAPGDSAAAQPVALLSRSLEHKLFAPGQNPLGHFIRVGAPDRPWRKIVGICGDAADYVGANRTIGQIYVPLAQALPLTHPLGVLLRTQGSPDAALAPLRHALHQIDPTLALYDAGPLALKMQREEADSDIAFLYVLELMAALPLLLSALGLYSVVAFTAAARRREIGIRSALGATAGQLQRFLLQGGMTMALLGLAAGLAVGWAGLIVLASGVGRLHDSLWLLLGLPALLLGTVAALAIYLPARRAALADPLAALRVQ